MPKYLPMSTTVREEFLLRLSEDEEPEFQERERQILEALLKANPRVEQQLVERGKLDQARAALRHLLAGRQLTLTQDDEQRIEACADLATLERWFDQAVTAASTSEALR